MKAQFNLIKSANQNIKISFKILKSITNKKKFKPFSYNKESIFDYSILILCLFNPSTMLVIERLAFDIFVFLFIIFITLNRIYFLNWFVIFFLALTKIYPALLGINIFLENLNRSLKKNSPFLVYLYHNY